METKSPRYVLVLMALVIAVTIAPFSVAEGQIIAAPVANYDLQGSEIWNTQLPAAILDDSWPVQLMDIASSGEITVGTGYPNMSVLYRLNQQGQIVWEQASNFSTIFGILHNAQGECYVNGTWEDETDTSKSVVKYDSSGNVAWIVTPGISQPTDFIESIALDSEGNLLLNCKNAKAEPNTASIYLLLVDANGDQIWEMPILLEEYNTDFFDAEFSADDSIMATGTAWDDENRFIITAFFNSQRELVWHDVFECADGVAIGGFVVREDPSGNIVVLASCAYDVRLLKYDREGALLWNVAHDSSATESGYGPLNLVVDSQGSSLIIGYDWPLSYIMKVDSAGSVKWFNLFENTDVQMYTANIADLAVDADRNAYVVGYSQHFDPPNWEKDLFAKKFSPDGEEIWTVNFSADDGSVKQTKAGSAQQSLVVAYPSRIAVITAADDDSVDDDDNDSSPSGDDDDDNNNVDNDDDDDDDSGGGCGR